MTSLFSARRRSPALLGSAVGFLVGQVAADPLSSWLASSPAPPPDVPGDVTRRWFIDNAAASSVHAAIMLISIGFLAVFVLRFTATALQSDSRSARVATGLGLASAVAVAMSSLVTWTLGVQAIALPSTLIELTRTGQVVVGGGLHVAFLGAFVLAASRSEGVPRPVRWFAVLAAVLAIGSLASIVIPHPVFPGVAGRLAGMGWCVVAAATVAGRHVARHPKPRSDRRTSTARSRFGGEGRQMGDRDPLGTRTAVHRAAVPVQERLLGQMTGQLDR